MSREWGFTYADREAMLSTCPKVVSPMSGNMATLNLIRNQRGIYRVVGCMDIDKYILEIRLFGDMDSWAVIRKFALPDITTCRILAYKVNNVYKEFIPVLLDAFFVPPGLIDLCLNDTSFKSQK